MAAAAVLVGGVGVGSSHILRFLRHRHRVLTGQCIFPHCPVFSSRTRSVTAATPTSSLASVSVESDQLHDIAAHGGEDCTGIGTLGCPICYKPLTCKSSGGAKEVPGAQGVKFECSTCRKAYVSNGVYLDLTISGGSKEYTEAMPAYTELFRSRLVSFLYERGWRQNFVFGGFPGPGKEFEMAKEYLKPTFGGTIVDASCGSGMFSRLFASSKLYSLVIALDFSENMLRQCSDFIDQEGVSRENLLLARADISRLPFVSNSVNAVHAGAALHCWPSPSAAVAEISRILHPGGVFVATTFIFDAFSPLSPSLKRLCQYYTSSIGHLYLSVAELSDLCRTCGLVNFMFIRNGSFVMLSATKPC